MPAGHGGAEGMKKCMVPRFARTIDRAARSARFARAYQMLKNSSYGKFFDTSNRCPREHFGARLRAVARGKPINFIR